MTKPQVMGSEMKKSVSTLHTCLSKWRLYLLATSIALFLGVVVSVSIPRRYAAQVKIADERKETDLLLGLNTFAAWAKGALDDHEGLRQPEVYHKLVETREFAEEMSGVTLEGYGIDYYHHIAQNHREPWWERWFAPEESEHERVIRIIRDNIRSKAAALYATVTLQVTDQDPVVAALLVDSVRVHLQRHMADYARDRSWRDLLDAEQKMSQAEERYKAARDDYANFEDTHRDISSAKVHFHARLCDGIHVHCLGFHHLGGIVERTIKKAVRDGNRHDHCDGAACCRLPCVQGGRCLRSLEHHFTGVVGHALAIPSAR